MAAGKTIEELAERALELGHWMLFKSPFEADRDVWVIGFTPLSTTGWNGRPDQMWSGPLHQVKAFAETWLDAQPEPESPADV